MYRDKKIGVVVPAYNEELHIGKVLDGMPDFVDAVYVVDDASTDRTAQIVLDFIDHSRTPALQPLAGPLAHSPTPSLTHSSSPALPHSRTLALTHSCSLVGPRIELVQHARNSGVGAAIVTGYKRCLADGMDIAAVMAGDNQADPSLLSSIVDPVVGDVAAYSKGTRRTDPSHLQGMSPWRRIGNNILRWLTVAASGNREITDPQCGYTAASRYALEIVDLDSVYSYYGYCNDLIVRFSALAVPVIEVPRPSRYQGEKSKIRYHRYMPKVSMLLLRLFIWRITGRLSTRRTPAVASSESAPVEESRA